MSGLIVDFTDIRRIWAKRAAAAQQVRRRLNPRGLTRPPRDAEERQWLEERGWLGESIEVQEHDAEYRAYFAKKYARKT